MGVCFRTVNELTSSGPNPARNQKCKPELRARKLTCPKKIMPEKISKVKLDLKNLSMLPSYFDYIFMNIFLWIQDKKHIQA